MKGREHLNQLPGFQPEYKPYLKAYLYSLQKKKNHLHSPLKTQVLNDYSEQGTRGLGEDRGPEMNTLVPLIRTEAHKQNIKQPHKTCHQ